MFNIHVQQTVYFLDSDSPPLVPAPGEESSIWHVTHTVPVNYSDSEINRVNPDQTAD